LISIDDVLNASNALREALETPTQRALTDLGELMRHGQLLLSHADKGERPEATRVMKNISDDVEAIGRAMRDFDTINANSLKNLLDPARNLVNDVRKALEVALADPKNKDKQETLRKAMTKLEDAGFDLAGNAIKGLPDDEAVQNAADIRNLENRLLQAVKRGNVKDATATAQTLQTKLNKQAILARGLANKQSNPKIKQNLLRASVDLTNVMRNISDASRDAIRDGRKQEALEKLILTTDDANDTIINSIEDPEEKLQALHWAMTDFIDLLKFPLTPNDQPDIAAIIRALEAQVLLGRSIANKISDPKKKEEITRKVNELDNLTQKVKKQAELVFTNPSDTTAQNKLKKLLNDAQNKGNELLGLIAQVQKLDERIVKNSAALEVELNNLESALKRGDKDSAERSFKAAKHRLAKAEELGGEAAILCGDFNLTQQLLNQVELLKKQEASFENSGNQYIKTQSKGNQDNLLNNVKQTRELNKKFTDLAKKAALTQEPSIDNGGNKDQIRNAAKVVQYATMALVCDDTPKGRLNLALKKIGEEMRKLSEAANAGDKKGMIICARNIASYVSKIIDDAKALGAKCSDQQLVDIMLGQAFASKNHAVVLKILAAVKTSTDNEDPTAELQLAQCAKNLSQAVVGTVKASDSCALKSKK